jgi:hypothetical protein
VSKPLAIALAETRKSVTTTINESLDRIPVCVMRMMLEEILNVLKVMESQELVLAQQQYKDKEEAD